MDSTDLPRQLRELLEGSSFEAPTLAFLDAAAIVLADNKTPFFPAYTDHGSEHVKRVMAAAVELVPSDVWSESLLHAEDACVLVCACLLHDIGMHIREEGFLALVSEGTRYEPCPWFDTPHPQRQADRPWPELWQSFRQDARHFSKSQLDRLLGSEHNGTPAVAFGDSDRHPDRWTESDRLLIGEFLRRHHARLAHEMAIHGFPGAPAADFPVLRRIQRELFEPIGVAARSHGEKLRTMVEYCKDRRSGSLRPWGTVLPYLMGLLRVADYFQLDAGRAPPLLLRLRNPVSRASVEEWNRHAAVSRISWEHTDRLAVYVEVNSSHGLRTHLQLSELLADLQHELDTTTAVLSEVYSSQSLSKLRLSRQRVRTNLDDRSLHEQLPYVPRRAALRSDEDLFRLVISDLYGNQPAVAGRELLQNAVDAVRERQRWEARHNRSPDASQFRTQNTDVCVTIEEHTDREMTLCVTDRGIGMTPEVVIDYLLKAGASFGPSPVDFEHLNTETSIDWMKAGRFGVGIFAAFLLGPTVEVETRHIGATRGVKFRADINAEDVKLEWADLPLGTKVSIKFEYEPDFFLAYLSDDEIRNKHLPMLESIADYYRLRAPRVEFRSVKQNGEVHRVRGSGDVPTLKDGSLGRWRTVKAPGFDAVMWTPVATVRRSVRQTNEPAALVHNGIVIREPKRSEFDPGPNLYRWTSGRVGSLVETPSVAVFDSRHLLEMTLHRYRLKSYTLPFERELLESIGLDIVAWALAGATEDHPLSLGWGLAPVMGRDSWLPLLPGLLSEYIERDLCVLWGEGDRGIRTWHPTEGWNAAFRFFTRIRSGVPWRGLPFRTALGLERRLEPRLEPGSTGVDPELLRWGLRLIDVGYAARGLAKNLNATAVTSVVLRKLGSDKKTPKGLLKRDAAWRDITELCEEETRESFAAYVSHGDPEQPGDVERMLRAAALIAPHAPRECVALTMLHMPRPEHGGDAVGGDAELTLPWDRLIGGRLERSPDKRKARLEEILATHPGARKAIKRWVETA
jgi:molecular chaperone HtpG